MADEQALRDALKRVAVALKTADVPFAVAGGYAAWARGGPEPDHDADVVVPVPQVAAAQHALEQAGLQVSEPPEDWLFKVFIGEEMVDVIHHFSGDVPVSDDLIARADMLPVDSVHMPVLSVTDVVVTKLRAMSEQYCDFGKVLPTVRALREQVDWDVVRRETEASPFADAFLQLAHNLGLVQGRH